MTATFSEMRQEIVSSVLLQQPTSSSSSIPSLRRAGLFLEKELVIVNLPTCNLCHKKSSFSGCCDLWHSWQPSFVLSSCFPFSPVPPPPWAIRVKTGALACVAVTAAVRMSKVNSSMVQAKKGEVGSQHCRRMHWRMVSEGVAQSSSPTTEVAKVVFYKGIQKVSVAQIKKLLTLNCIVFFLRD